MTTTEPGTTAATTPAPAQGDAERCGRPGRRSLLERHDAVVQGLMGRASIEQVAARMGLHPATIEQWRDQALACMSEGLRCQSAGLRPGAGAHGVRIAPKLIHPSP